MFYKVRNFFASTARIFSYFPVIWKDRDWDYDFLLDLLEFKLKRIKKYFLESKNWKTFPETLELPREIPHTDHYSTRDIIIDLNRVLKHIENYRGEEYLAEPLPFEIDWVPTNKGIVVINKGTGKPLSQKEEELYSNFVIADHLEREKEYNAIFTDLAKYSSYWWD